MININVQTLDNKSSKASANFAGSANSLPNKISVPRKLIQKGKLASSSELPAKMSKTTKTLSGKFQAKSLSEIRTGATPSYALVKEHGLKMSLFKTGHIEDDPDEEKSETDDSTNIKQAWKRAQKQEKIDNFVL